MNTHKRNTAPEHRVNTITHAPSRGNHEPCFVPECVRQYTGEPLYILVAWWCYQQQDWLRRTQIAEAFHIPLRRASYLMAYLRNKTKRVTCESREALIANNVYRYEIFVTRVMPSFSRKKETSASTPRRTRSRIGNADTSRVNILWNQLSSQRRAILSDNKEEDD
ncbi:CaiF/GrlA family transcriptional regulator [Salmonella enterica subsp. enterica]|nr:transcriptional regulator CaiF [Salmonella enterica subsp. enterica serovar Poona]HAC7072452.1 CaiF/GrlA family transcriptional regulator [Salmonella enterica]EBW2885985.1 transcriptional regulator CaiF [Salmonella enterica subsp. enterica serovar Poona]ECD3709406.1 CaiF/GrlA family transcriptional regulator [Salmonella enterica subsp. enterica serovar Poona]ECG6029378.1 CaiF/GrlA family transcriptional regulator [Salmonella enterica subsp. enterica serovar Poona]